MRAMVTNILIYNVHHFIFEKIPDQLHNNCESRAVYLPMFDTPPDPFSPFRPPLIFVPFCTTSLCVLMTSVDGVVLSPPDGRVPIVCSVLIGERVSSGPGVRVVLTRVVVVVVFPPGDSVEWWIS